MKLLQQLQKTFEHWLSLKAKELGFEKAAFRSDPTYYDDESMHPRLMDVYFKSGDYWWAVFNTEWVDSDFEYIEWDDDGDGPDLPCESSAMNALEQELGKAAKGIGGLYMDTDEDTVIELEPHP